MSVDPVEIAKSKNLTLTPTQELFLTRMFSALISETPSLFIGLGAPGVGKSLCIAPVTAALVNSGKRVLIATPTYRHLERVTLPFLQRFDVNNAISQGFNRHKIECPLKNNVKPTQLFCTKNRVNCTSFDCSIKNEEKLVSISSVVVTVFQKVLSMPDMVDDFDVVIFDESHGLEDALYRSRTYVLNQDKISKISSLIPDSDSYIQDFSNILSRLIRSRREEVPLIFTERIHDIFVNINNIIESEINQKEEKKLEVPNDMIEVYYDIKNSIFGFTHTADFRFAIHENSIIIIPNQIHFAPFYNRNIGAQTSIALISATVEEPASHATDAGFPFRPITATATIEAPQGRFSRRPILGLIDGPVLRNAPEQPQAYSNARDISNEIICQTLKSLRSTSLILCRSKRDSDSIESYIRRDPVIRDRIYIPPDVDDPSILQELINNAILQGRDIVITSASSSFWEGVTIDNLKLVVIDALPYPTPRPLEIRRLQGNFKRSRIFRFMIRRLQQGIGRLVRKEGDWGIALVIDGRFNSQRGLILSSLPNYLHNITFIPRERITYEITDIERRYRT
jgi:Rad3-related DNA helicase